MSYKIRKPSVTDTSQLFHLIRDHAAFEKSAATLSESDLARLQSEGQAVRFLVAAEGKDLLGYAAVTFDWSVWRARRYAHLDCLFVAQRHRGRGVGKALLERAREDAGVEGIDRIEWQTPTWNQGAVRFYVREGATFQTKFRFSISVS
ncbi:GNAT family N-acetyltransferase [Shinella granuli]|uniref:GNAT family N-acetyltransferase n=1 Tax=Shinella granuli TaxID=323621 RepID=UPI001FE21AA9|nr:GNAT family N-acetyltransferase [Shinella granuli]